MSCVCGEGLSDNLDDLACENVEGRREMRLWIAVVAVEFLNDDKAFFYTVH